MTTTLYRAGWIVAFQGGEHRILRDGCLVVDDDRITHVGPTYDGPADRTVELPDRIITPGLINTHAHLDESPIDKSVQEDVGNRQFWLTGLIEILPTEMNGLDDEGARACVDYSLIELARTGTTTVVQMGGVEEYAADAIEASGLRGYVAPMYRSGRWFTPDGKRVDYAWDADDGRSGFERATAYVDRLRGRADGRVRGSSPRPRSTPAARRCCGTPRQAADDLGVPISLHASQGVWEFQEMTRRHGRTPVEWLSDLGFLGPRTVLGHAIFISGSSWVNFAGDDLALLARSGTSVSYNAWCFIRRGIVMESFPDYVAAGVNMCLGTDTAPQSMIESLRWTAIAGKVAARRTDVSTARRRLRRGDGQRGTAARPRRPRPHRPGRQGGPAVLARRRLHDDADARPDPQPRLLRAALRPRRRARRRAAVVEDGVVLGADVDSATRRVQEAGERIWSRWSEGDWAGRTLDEVAPADLRRVRAELRQTRP